MSKGKGKRSEPGAAEYAKQYAALLKPTSVSDLIKKAKKKTHRRMAWNTAKAIFESFKSANGRTAPGGSKKRSPKRRTSAVGKRELFLVVTRDYGRKLEVIPHASIESAERSVTERIRAGNPARVLRASPMKIETSIRLTP